MSGFKEGDGKRFADALDSLYKTNRREGRLMFVRYPDDPIVPEKHLCEQTDPQYHVLTFLFQHFNEVNPTMPTNEAAKIMLIAFEIWKDEFRGTPEAKNVVEDLTVTSIHTGVLSLIEATKAAAARHQKKPSARREFAQKVEFWSQVEKITRKAVEFSDNPQIPPSE